MDDENELTLRPNGQLLQKPSFKEDFEETAVKNPLFVILSRSSHATIPCVDAQGSYSRGRVQAAAR